MDTRKSQWLSSHLIFVPSCSFDWSIVDNHNGVTTHLELDILECEVRCTLGSITTNEASGGDRIPAEVFKILTDDALKCCTQYVSKFGKLSIGAIVITPSYPYRLSANII